ncbi:MAG: hypothetical protein ACK417_05245 [Bacteroidia bacterium]
MKKYRHSPLAFMAFIVLLLPFTLAKAQPQPAFELVDSLKINLTASLFGTETPPYAKILKRGHEVFFLAAETGRLYVIDLQKGLIRPFLPATDSLDVPQIANFDLGPNSIFTIDRGENTLREYDLNGQQIGSTRLNRMFSAVYVSARINFAYNEQRNSFLLEVAEHSPERSMLRKPQRAKKHFERNNLIVEMDRNGKKLRYFGAFDSLYRQQFYFHGSHYSFAVNKAGDLLLHQELSDAIQLYPPPYERAKTLAFRGQHLKLPQQQLPITVAPYFEVEDYYSHVISSYQYTYMTLLNSSGLCYRGYADAATDSTLERSYPERDLPAKPKMCVAPSPRKLDQLDLLRQKPRYVQLIDPASGKLLFDGPFPFEGKYFLPSKDIDWQEFHTYSWNNGWLFIYTYKIVYPH